jgi:putative transposase
MARKLRLEYEGAIYHLMSRGDRREPIFKDDLDRQLFLATLAQACAKTDWQVHAYCLMPNHFHLVVETPKANLVAGMKWFLGNYTNRFNRKHKLFGHVFSGRYKSLLVDGSGTGYLRTVCDYVHLNPVRAKLLRREQKLGSYAWSSYRDYLRPAGLRPSWLWVGRVLGEMGIPKDSAAGRREFARRMELRRWEDEPAEWKRVRRGWCLGDEAFRKELVEAMGERMGKEHYGEERQETAQAKAERILREEFKRCKWTMATLAQKRKGDEGKVRMAQRLRAETTMTLHWIAERLKMGTKTHLVHLLYWQDRKKSKRK